MLKECELRKLSKNLQTNPDDFMSSFRENIRMYIDQKEITLAEISELADMPESTLKSFVYGNSKDCHLSTAIKLARVFHISMDELVGAETLSPLVCEILQTVRQLPPNFTQFIKYTTNLHYRKIIEGEITEKSILVSEAEINGNGTMCLTNVYSFLDISKYPHDERSRIFMGFKIPSDLYEPLYFEGDTLLIANDRNPRDGENVLVSIGTCLFILKTKYEKIDGVNKRVYYSIRDGKPRSSEDRIKQIIGYVVDVDNQTV